LFERCYAKLIRFLRGKLPESDVHDLIQDCLTVLIDKREVVENDEAFLFGVAARKLKQYYERQVRLPSFISFDWTSQVMSMEALATSLSVRVARRNDLEVAMQKLPLRQYQAFQLRFMENLTEDKTAQVLEVSKATLKRDLDRARTTLASVLGDAGDDKTLRQIVLGYTRQR
jgi:RNA polymerase sigma factor (sigma-70 family)